MAEGDILMPISDEQQSEYQKFFKNNSPATLRPYLFLTLQDKWKKTDESLRNKIDPRCLYQIYVPRNGKPENRTFIAVSAESAALVSTLHNFY